MIKEYILFPPNKTKNTPPNVANNIPKIPILAKIPYFLFLIEFIKKNKEKIIKSNATKECIDTEFR